VRSDIVLEDTTLRDGEQAPGIAFSRAQKVKIHDKLVEIGVRWMEVGIPAMGGEELETLEYLVNRGSDAVLVAWNRGVAADVQQSLDLGFRAIHIGLPTSAGHLRARLRRDRSWLLQQATDLVKLAKDRGAFVSISAEDVGRTEPTFLVEYAGHVAAAGADRLRLSDTVGILTPQGYAGVVRNVVGAGPIDVQCHAHNDYGLAVANTLAGLEAGARYFHVTVNGIGERAGMPDFNSVVLALTQLFGRDLGIRLERLTKLSRLVADCCAVPIPPWQPIAGDNIFAHESGIHAKGVLQDSSTFEPFQPELVGGERRFVLGKHSGRAALQYVLKERGVVAGEEMLGPCLEAVRARAIANRGSVSAQQAEQLYHEVVSMRLTGD
jgi:homocitrate synthase NifV